MKELEWTETAKSRWEQFLQAKVKAAKLDAEAGWDLREDLSLHLDEELMSENREIVNAERIERAIGELGGEPTLEVTPVSPSQEKVTQKTSSGSLIFWGVALPLAVFLLELLTGFCSSVFFDPLESWLHVGLVAFAVGCNWWLLTNRSYQTAIKWRALLAGASFAVTLLYGILFFPLVWLSAIAVIYFGIGLIPLAPVINVFVTRRIQRRHSTTASSEWQPWWKRAFLGTLIVLILLQAPSIWTRVALHRALSDNQERAESGVNMLRGFSSKKTLLRACYEGNRGTSMSTDISGWVVDGWQLFFPPLWDENFRSFDSDEVRTVYYRVTGSSFNTKAPPSFVVKGSILSGRSSSSERMQWDSALGGEEVSVRLAGLDLVKSRLDGHLDPASGLSYQEWTLVFRNLQPGAQEARMQMLLPEDGVVSRVTLWVNGEPREAAFSSKSKVRAAYQSVAVVQQRDPVLVTATGPGRVLVQCFPVPAYGGEMKIRIGMTAPLERGRLAAPILLERNFGIDPSLETSVWMQGPSQFSYRGEKKSHSDGDGQSLQLSFPAAAMEKEGSYFACSQGKAPVVWCQDQFADSGEEYLIRTLTPTHREPLSQCILVVDGSARMKPYADDLQALASRWGDQITVVIADDGVNQDGLEGYRFSGGRDNGPALEWAMREARAHENSAVIWVHGPQTMLSGSEEALAQLLERGSAEVPLYTVACQPGGNRLLEKIFTNRAVRMGPRLSDGVGDLQPWLEELLAGRSTQNVEWSRSSQEPESPMRVWDQLARYWAAETVREGSRQQSADGRAIAFAAKYQLVTAYSGAVVLETAQQYKDHGLTPVDSSTTPDIPATPEPGTFLLLILGGLLALGRRQR